jgi:hypothetical protein
MSEQKHDDIPDSKGLYILIATSLTVLVLLVISFGGP